MRGWGKIRWQLFAGVRYPHPPNSLQPPSAMVAPKPASPADARSLTPRIALAADQGRRRR